MLDILAITGPIYFSIAIGFIATRFGLFAKTDRQVFGKFVINIAVPALLFKAVAERPIAEILNVDYMLAYLLGTLVMIGLGLFWCRSVSRLNPTTSAFYTMGMVCSNSVFIGYPVLLLTLAPVAGIAMALNSVLENFIVTPLMLALAEGGRAKSGRWYGVIGQSLARLLVNPMIIGLLAGIVFSALGWKLPGPVAQTVGMFAMTTGTLALFFIGCTLVGLPMRGMVKKVMPVVVGKLILHPLAVFLSLLLLPMLGMPALDADLRMAAILMAAMPMMSLYSILAQIFGQEDFSAAALLLTTIASFFTLSGLLWALKVVSM